MRSMQTQRQYGFAILETVLIIIVIALLVFAGYYVWHNRSTIENTHNTASSSSQSGKPSGPANVVVDSQLGSADLVSFLKSDNTGCTGSAGTGWFRIEKEVNGSQAALDYGCSKNYNQGLDVARMLVKKVNDKWQIISPTNQWVYQIPSCKMINDNKILATLEPQCWTVQTSVSTTVVANQNSQYADSYASCVTASGSRVPKNTSLCITKDDVTFSQ